jgi:hypothetical protein
MYKGWGEHFRGSTEKRGKEKMWGMANKIIMKIHERKK